MTLVVLDQLGGEPVSLDEAKAHLRVDITDDDSTISTQVQSARGYVEQVTATLDLPVTPVTSITGIFTIDEAGVETEFDAANYYLVSDKVVLKQDSTWPDVQRSHEGILVRFNAGYTDVPAGLKSAILLIVGDLYENREASLVGSVSSSVQFSVDALVRPYRLHWGL
jgi:hypothetical protein